MNVKGSLFCAQAAFRDMQPRGSGSIVNLASQAALLSLPNQVVYTATKGAVAAMTRSQAIDWVTHGIRVNAIAPTFVWTPMAEPTPKIQQVHDASVRRIPLGRIGHPRDIAGAAVYLCTDASSLITGHVLPVDGGWTAGEPGLDLEPAAGVGAGVLRAGAAVTTATPRMTSAMPPRTIASGASPRPTSTATATTGAKDATRSHGSRGCGAAR